VAAGDQPTLARLAERLAAADLDPATAVALGYALYGRGMAADAVRILRTVRDRHPSDPSVQCSLQYALMAQSPSDPIIAEEAVGCGRAEVAAHPERAAGHYHLGQAYDTGKNDPAAADRHYLKALERNPRFTFAMINLGANREGKGDLAGAERWYRKAAETDPQFAKPHHNLGWLLELRGDMAGAEAEYLKSIELYPEGELSRKRLAVVRLLPRLDDVIAGRAAPATPAEAIDFAQLCIRPFRRQYAAAARLLERAFADDPKLAAAERYNAACNAALAGCGQGADPPADPAERATLRGKALGWLRTDLARRAKQAESDKPSDREAARQLSWWLEDSDLAGVRPGPGRIDMATDERSAWDALWADVRATRDSASNPASDRLPAPKPGTASAPGG
jgi:tetratricopeptide (TPR) repeat protein